MIEDKNKDLKNAQQHVSASDALDDEQRIRVLSPAMLVFKRFVRNKLAITGAIIIGVMFLFSFLGGWIMGMFGYSESRVFNEYIEMPKDYAGVSENTEYKFTTIDGSEFPMTARSQFVLAVNKKETTMSSGGREYGVENIGDDFFMIHGLKEVAVAMVTGRDVAITTELAGTFKSDFSAAIADKAESFVSSNTNYIIKQDKKSYKAYLSEPLAIATKRIFDFAASDADPGYDFRYKAELAVNQNAKEFTVGSNRYHVEEQGDIAEIYQVKGGEKVLFANISKYNVQAVYGDIFLTIDFKQHVKELIAQGAEEFTYTNPDGTEQHYTIIRENNLWTIKWIEQTYVVMDYASPSKEHLVGTDGNGMDLLTRLMFGGRVSLIIGFIVVIIETVLGVILGGIAGYFGKWVDNLLMRLVDIFNSIPSLPLIIILGAMMDELRIDPQIRMIYLMLLLGILGWPGIARLVRGQILSLREQEFMVAAEATGISVKRRIFKHLVPNVIPQLIVISTMSLGGVILTESVLSFLGMGVKFPFASWGNIINDVTNSYVMTNYLFVWIPAGFCILVTVLGFNFIGDGLRDAFDPKMKR